MTNTINTRESDSVQANSEALVKKSLPKRRAAEKRFRLYGIIAIGFSILMLGTLFTSIISKGYPAFQQAVIYLPIKIDSEIVYPNGQQTDTARRSADYSKIIKDSIYAQFPEVTERVEKRQLYALISPNAIYQIRDKVVADPSLVGQTLNLELLASDDADQFFKGQIGAVDGTRISSKQGSWLGKLAAEGKIVKTFNITFFTSGDSRSPEQAGILGAILGSFWALLITISLSLPIGIGAAIYLEEFAKKNRINDFIEVNINNLAAVPSIIFGLLGLAMFLNIFGLPRSAPLVGGLVLSLMVLPTIIIAGRISLNAIPPSIREAALGVGASKMQVIYHHLLPLAMPGILTGSIIGMARALGESAPLLMIGMVAFIVDLPSGPLDPSTVLPVQIYLWADSAERAFVEKSSAAILVLLAFLIIMNLTAVLLRKKFETKW